MLALMLTGKPLFESTRQLMAARRLMRRVRDIAQPYPCASTRRWPAWWSCALPDRFPSLAEAIAAVRVRPGARDTAAAGSGGRTPSGATRRRQPAAAGTRVGTDYEIVSRLGQGGMAAVYAARHLVSGRTRALKIARADDAAEEALRGEYQALCALDHPNVVRVIDLTKMVEGRLTLVMERVGGATLRQWLAQHPTPEPTAQRRLAEDLLAGLEYLEQKSVTHKDLKPENLLVSDGRLTIIDFSLAAMPEDAPYGGTALYRDPASARWTHATDRSPRRSACSSSTPAATPSTAASPSPDKRPAVRDDDIEPPGLAAFFRKALDPTSPRSAFPRRARCVTRLLVALGEDVATSPRCRPPLRSSTRRRPCA